jgi:hypothetical protein
MKLILLSPLLLLAACQTPTPCNPSKTPIQVVAATNKGEYRDWVTWTLFVRNGNTYHYCRGQVLNDAPIEVGKFYMLNGFSQETSLGDIYDSASDASSN